MLAGRIMRPRATSSRTNSGLSFSRRATYSISSVTIPWRAKCISETFVSPVRDDSVRRFAIHSARGWGTEPLPFTPLPFTGVPLVGDIIAILGRYLDRNYTLRKRRDYAAAAWSAGVACGLHAPE